MHAAHAILGFRLPGPWLWLLVIPAALAAGFWGPPLICEAAYRTRKAVVPAAVIAVIILVAGRYLAQGGIRP